MNSTFKIRLLIIEENSLMLESYSVIINNASKYLVVGAFSTFQEAISSVKSSKPDIILLDPDQLSLDSIRKFKQLFPHLKMLGWSATTEVHNVFEVIRAGLDGYVLNDGNYNALLQSIDEIVKGGAPLSSAMARMIVSSFHVNSDTPLTARETEVLDLLAQGKTYKEISEKLFIARETSRKHISNIYQKLKVRSKSEAISVATNKKFIVSSRNNNSNN